MALTFSFFTTRGLFFGKINFILFSLISTSIVFSAIFVSASSFCSEGFFLGFSFSSSLISALSNVLIGFFFGLMMFFDIFFSITSFVNIGFFKGIIFNSELFVLLQNSRKTTII